MIEFIINSIISLLKINLIFLYFLQIVNKANLLDASYCYFKVEY